jgi:hypothetical protein
MGDNFTTWTLPEQLQATESKSARTDDPPVSIQVLCGDPMVPSGAARIMGGDVIFQGCKWFVGPGLTWVRSIAAS